MKRVMVTGSRSYRRRDRVWNACFEMAGDILVVGDCPTGADLYARQWAEFYQRRVEVHRANWARHGKKAGPMRNEAIVRSTISCASGFLEPGLPCHGTNHCLGMLRRYKVPTKVFHLE